MASLTTVRVLAVSVALCLLVGPSSLCDSSTGLRTRQALCQAHQRVWGTADSACCVLNSHQQHQTWHSFLLLRGLAMLWLVSATACVTRSAVTAKVLLALGDSLASAMRALWQLAVCADLLLSCSSTPTANPAPVTCRAPGCALLPGGSHLLTPAHLIVATFFLNQLVLFTQHAGSDLAWGLAELLPLSVNVWLLHTSHASHASISSSLPRLVALALVSRVLLPLLVSHMPQLWHSLRSSSANSIRMAATGGSDNSSSTSSSVVTARTRHVSVT